MGVVVHAEHRFAERRKAAEALRERKPVVDEKLARLQAIRERMKSE